jgi:hypothetical protein
MLQKSSVRFTVFTLGGYGETVLLAEGLPPAAKQSKVLTAALKRCAPPPPQSSTPMEFFRKLAGPKPSGFEQ